MEHTARHFQIFLCFIFVIVLSGCNTITTSVDVMKAWQEPDNMEQTYAFYIARSEVEQEKSLRLEAKPHVQEALHKAGFTLVTQEKNPNYLVSLFLFSDRRNPKENCYTYRSNTSYTIQDKDTGKAYEVTKEGPVEGGCYTVYDIHTDLYIILYDAHEYRKNNRLKYLYYVRVKSVSEYRPNEAIPALTKAIFMDFPNTSVQSWTTYFRIK